MQNQLIRIQKTSINNQEINAVSARDLHKKLELKTQFTDWIKQFIDDFSQDTDYINISAKTEDVQSDGHVINRNITEYLFSLDMAKQVAMLTRTSKGKEVRLYFIECEKKLQQLQLKVPTTFIEAMTLALEQAKQLEAQKPLVDFANTVQTSSALIDMKDLAKVISDTTIKIGRNTLMKLLRDRGFLNMDNTPSQKSVNADLMKAVEKTWINPKTDNAEITIVAHITGKGQIYFCNNIRKFMELNNEPYSITNNFL